MSPRGAGAQAAVVAVAVCALGSVFVSLGAAAPPAAQARARALYGIGDQSAATFADPRFAWLGVQLVRLVVPYDTVRHPAELATARAWLNAARFRRLEPLVVFSHSAQHPHLLPSVADYRAAVLAFRHAFPWVRDWGTWDEENHVSQPTAHDPPQAARFYNMLSGMCGSCSILAADVLDQPGMAHWLRRFEAYAIRPHLWGLHNYYDLNHGGRQRTAVMLRTVPGDVWFSETGGLVWRWNTHTHGFVVRGEVEATRAARRLRALVALSRRIQRVYYYHWRVGVSLSAARRHPGHVTWDSGLVRPDCSARAALRIFAADIGRDPGLLPRAVLDRYGNCSAPPVVAPVVVGLVATDAPGGSSGSSGAPGAPPG